MDLPSLRKLSLADLDEKALRSLIDNGEHLFVEFKRQPPPAPKFGAAVASFANTLGGWVLLGVEDKTPKGSEEKDRQIVGWSDLNPQTDVQSHIASLLQKEVDPLPPFVAKSIEVDGKTVVAIRVFESTDAPHIVRGTGAVYVRTSKGKEPVETQQGLLALARSAEVADRAARDRLRNTAEPGKKLKKVTHAGNVRLELRAAPLTVTPQFADWPISSSGAKWIREFAGAEAIIRPEARGVTCLIPIHTLINVDSGGVVVVASQRVLPPNYIDLDNFRRLYVRPVIDQVSAVLEAAEAIGTVVFEIWLTITHGYITFAPPNDDPETEVYKQHIGGSLTIPATDEDRKEEAARIQREIGRYFGVDQWEGVPTESTD